MIATQVRTVGILVAAIALSTTGLVVPHAGAEIVSVTGQVEHLAPPPGSLPKGKPIYAWDERQNVTLSGELKVDGTPANWSKESEIPRGTVINSHILHFDPMGPFKNTAGGWVTFANEIVGVIYRSNTLHKCDSLGTGGLSYPSWLSTRGIEPAEGDLLWVSGDQKTLHVGVSAVFGKDEIRALTIPEPASCGLVGLAALALRRRGG